MPTFYGTDEVRRQKQRLEKVFTLIDGVQSIDSEAQAHYARYLCVRLAGFAEQSVKDLVSEHARAQASPTVHRYVEAKIRGLWGINERKLKETLDSFDERWWPSIEAAFEREIAALQSVGKLRDNISHGGDSGITLPTIKQYKQDVLRLVDHLCTILDPRAVAQ